MYYVEDSNGNKTYTFKIERDTENNSNFLENLVLKKIGGENLFAYIVKYDSIAQKAIHSMSSEELHGHIFVENLGATTTSEIFGLMNPCPATMYPVANWVYIPGRPCKNNHTKPSDCELVGDEAPVVAHYEVVYTMQIVEGSGNCSGGGGGDFPTTPHSGGGNPTTTSNVNDCEIKKKPFTDVPTLKTAAKNLATQTSDNVEHAITVTENADPSNPITTLPPGADGSIIASLNLPQKYIYFGHTHNSPAYKTYSLPSWGDLQWISVAYSIFDVVDSNTVFSVSTADGTHYAFTISNWFGFTQALYVPKDASAEEMEKAKTSSDIGMKYIEGGIKNGQEIIPHIQEDSTNKEQDLVYFLQMMKENNMGINLFEVDPQFNTFTRVTLNSNKTIKRTPCN